MEIGRAELASLIGVSDRTVTQLAKDGIVIRAARGKYEMEKSVAAYCGHLRETAAGRGGKDKVESLAEERARLARLQADGHDLKNSQLRGELVSASEMETVMSRDYAAVRAGMLAVMPRVQQRIVGLSAADVAIIDQEVRQALQALGEDRDGSTGSGQAPVSPATDPATET